MARTNENRERSNDGEAFWLNKMSSSGFRWRKMRKTTANFFFIVFVIQPVKPCPVSQTERFDHGPNGSLQIKIFQFYTSKEPDWWPVSSYCGPTSWSGLNFKTLSPSRGSKEGISFEYATITSSLSFLHTTAQVDLFGRIALATSKSTLKEKIGPCPFQKNNPRIFPLSQTN